ncbi:MAG: hypothetical protein N4A74_01920 [Carboxylicivirga sp.]|nr:hypothetical protein [Carboxylicivirga sp.]
MKFTKYLILFCFMCLGVHALAQPDSTYTQIEAWDNSIVDYRCASADTITYYKSLEEYQYTSNTEILYWWQELVNWLLSFIRISDGSLSLIGWLILLIAVAVIVFIIIRLLGVPIKGLFVFSKSTKVTQLNFALSNMDIESEELEKMMKVSIQNKAYREATRVLFLLSLRALHRKNHIEWNAFKTDRDYYYEVKNQQLKEKFLLLIRQYEYVWFGKFELSEPEFESINTDYKQFINQITTN